MPRTGGCHDDSDSDAWTILAKKVPPRSVASSYLHGRQHRERHCSSRRSRRAPGAFRGMRGFGAYLAHWNVAFTDFVCRASHLCRVRPLRRLRYLRQAFLPCLDLRAPSHSNRDRRGISSNGTPRTRASSSTIMVRSYCSTDQWRSVSRFIYGGEWRPELPVRKQPWPVDCDRQA